MGSSLDEKRRSKRNTVERDARASQLKASSTAIEAANRKTSDEFVTEYLQPSTPWPTKWLHPTTKHSYTLRLVSSEDLSRAQIDACFNLIESTSGDDYRHSAAGWHPEAKRKEMRSPGLRYVLVARDSWKEEDDDEAGGEVEGFTSLMPTFENGEPVVYCYEIHLSAGLQGTGLGRQLMKYVTTVADKIPTLEKVMLTCFVCNGKARAFYERLGFDVDDSSPGERKLRGGKVVVPDYIIMSRRTERCKKVRIVGDE